MLFFQKDGKKKEHCFKHCYFDEEFYKIINFISDCVQMCENQTYYLILHENSKLSLTKKLNCWTDLILEKYIFTRTFARDIVFTCYMVFIVLNQSEPKDVK